MPQDPIQTSLFVSEIIAGQGISIDKSTGRVTITSVAANELAAGAGVSIATASGVTTFTSTRAASLATTALSTVGAGVITAAALISGVVARGGAQANAAFTDTTDTGANLDTALGSTINQAWLVDYENSTDAAATIAGGVGVTASGILVVPSGYTATFLLSKTGAATYTLKGYRLAGPNSAPSGTFTANGASAVTVTDTRVTANSVVIATVKTPGGTVGAIPAVKTITPGTGFTIAGTASDTSVYNYLIIG